LNCAPILQRAIQDNPNTPAFHQSLACRKIAFALYALYLLTQQASEDGAQRIGGIKILYQRNLSIREFSGFQ